jgi:hypothetical protein
MYDDSANSVSEPPPPAMNLRRGRLGRDAVTNNELDVDVGNLCVLDASVNWTDAVSAARNASGGGDDDDAHLSAAISAAAQRAATGLFARLASLPAAAPAGAGSAPAAPVDELLVKLPAGRELLPVVRKQKPKKPSK